METWVDTVALEIERKFLVIGDGWRRDATRSMPMRQAYLTRGGRTSIRVRTIGNREAILTIKTAAAGTARNEFEYPIPMADAEQLMAEREGALIAKTRHLVPGDGVTWEVDVFEGDNQGLILAEVELTHVDQPFAMPAWLGREVTGERRYYNADLALLPFARWPDR